MAFKTLLSGLLSLALSLGVAQSAQAQVPPESEQMVVVVTEQWQSVPAKLLRFEKQRGHWKSIGQPISAVVGKKGLGWGRGLFSPQDVQNNTYRKEGDKRAPAGVFSFGSIFGLANTADAQKKLNPKMPYIHLSDSIRCIGEGQSQYYNMLVDLKKVKRDWKRPQANEYMRLDAIRDEGAYRWGIFVNHNSNLNPKGMQRNTIAGSCIFLHVWKGTGVGTSGCTAMTKTHLKAILKWLDKKKKPVLVQLPRTEYLRLQTQWHLPALPSK